MNVLTPSFSVSECRLFLFYLFIRGRYQCRLIKLISNLLAGAGRGAYEWQVMSI